MSEFVDTALGPETEAHRLVGKFLQNFALLEQGLDAGIGKLLRLDDGRNDIVCSSIPFAKKLGVFFSAEGLLAAIPDAQRKKLLKVTRSKILDLNKQRVMFAHNPFSAGKDGIITFRRVMADTKLQVSNVALSYGKIEELCEESKKIVLQIDDLVRNLEPYMPMLDFSDPRNSGFIAAIL